MLILMLTVEELWLLLIAEPPWPVDTVVRGHHVVEGRNIVHHFSAEVTFK